MWTEYYSKVVSEFLNWMESRRFQTAIKFQFNLDLGSVGYCVTHNKSCGVVKFLRKKDKVEISEFSVIVMRFAWNFL